MTGPTFAPQRGPTAGASGAAAKLGTTAMHALAMAPFDLRAGTTSTDEMTATASSLR